MIQDLQYILPYIFKQVGRWEQGTNAKFFQNQLVDTSRTSIIVHISDEARGYMKICLMTNLHVTESSCNGFVGNNAQSCTDCWSDSKVVLDSQCALCSGIDLK
ncbi:Hypothetical_protein [Hexamita inflata]|uniref:Hypothetical_protein n=1 Tax=Hexamita inflata TaxID=28002 RepID=A0AA86TD32_9EUKA|nr:Hypothetical protein HINF_LOCUS2130 [Hexamita inflata]